MWFGDSRVIFFHLLCDTGVEVLTSAVDERLGERGEIKEAGQC